MVKPVITLEPEEVRILIEYLSHFEQDLRKYKDMEKIYFIYTNFTRAFGGKASHWGTG